MSNEYIWETFDGLFKTVYAQSRRVEELEARLAVLEEKLDTRERDAIRDAQICTTCRNTYRWHELTNFKVCKVFTAPCRHPDFFEDEITCRSCGNVIEQKKIEKAFGLRRCLTCGNTRNWHTDINPCSLPDFPILTREDIEAIK